MTCVVCILWQQWHEAWCGLPPPRHKALKYLCSEPVGEDMGAMPWFNWALDMKLTQAYDDYAWNRSTMPCAPGKNSHGRNAMLGRVFVIVVAYYVAFIRVEKKVQRKPYKKGLLGWKKCWENGHVRMTLWLRGQSTQWGNLSGCSLGPEVSPKVRVPKPKGFNGNRNAKELKNFLWDIEQFFKVAHVSDGEKVSITNMYLTGDAKLDSKNERRSIPPTNTSWVAKESLKRLRHIESVRKYVKEFSSLMLHIKNMSKNDKFFNFMFGLQGWAQTELRRQGVHDLPTAMAVANCLMDYKMGDTISTMQKPKSKGGKKAKVESKTSKKSGWKKQNKKGGAGVKPMKKTTKFCIPPDDRMLHLQWPIPSQDYSKRKTLGPYPSRVNPLQLLNVIHGETLIQKSLMHVHAIVNGVRVKAMVDGGLCGPVFSTR
ncbi:hypothetical protein AAG906_020640 [Vitis piasezkii]